MDEQDPKLASALQQVAAYLNDQGWDFCLVGGLAASHWGRSRKTDDIDLVLLTGFGDEEPFIDALTNAYRSRMSDAAEFARVNRILLLQSPSGVEIDVSLGALEFEIEMLRRARVVEVLPGVSVRTATAEDIVVMKVIAGRPRDIDDIERIIGTQGDRLDANYIRHWLADLAELWIETDLVGSFEQVLQSVNQKIDLAKRWKRPASE